VVHRLPPPLPALSVLGAGSPSKIIPRISRAQSGRTRPGTPASPGASGVADGPRCRRDWAAARTFTMILVANDVAIAGSRPRRTEMSASSSGRRCRRGCWGCRRKSAH